MEDLLIEKLKKLKSKINLTGFALTHAEEAMKNSPTEEEEREYYLRESDLEIDLEELWKILDKIDVNAMEIFKSTGFSLGDIGVFVASKIYYFLGIDPLPDFYAKLFPRNRVDPREFLTMIESCTRFCFTDSSSFLYDYNVGWRSEAYEIDWEDLDGIEYSTKDLKETLEFLKLPRDINLEKLNDFCEGKITPTSVSDFMAKEHL